MKGFKSWHPHGKGKLKALEMQRLKQQQDKSKDKRGGVNGLFST